MTPGRLLSPPLLFLHLPPLVIVRGKSPPAAGAPWLLVHVVTPLGRTLAPPPLLPPVSASTPPSLLLGPPRLIPCLPALTFILSPAVLKMLVNIDQVPGVAGHWLHPDLLDPLPLGSSLMILSSYVIEETLGLIEADPTEEAVIASLAGEVTLAHMKMVISVLVFLITLLTHKHQVTQFTDIFL